MKKKNEREALLNRFDDICQDVSHIRKYFSRYGPKIGIDVELNVKFTGKSCIKKFSSDDVKRADSFLIRNKTYDCPRVKSKDDFSCYIYDSKEEILGRKEEFRLVLCNLLIIIIFSLINVLGKN